MTKIHNLISSSLKDHKKNILLQTSLSDALEKYFTMFDIHKTMEPFANYDTIITDQSNIKNIIPNQMRFLSNIIIIDNVSQYMDHADNDYWQGLAEIYSKYNELYKCIFIAINEIEYIKSNNAHNYFIKINDEHGWRAIV